MTVKQLNNLCLWEKVREYKGWNPYIRNEGQIADDEVVEFDDEFKVEEKDEELGNKFDCCFEEERKGIYFVMSDEKSHVEFSFYSGYECKSSVCLRDEDKLRLIKLLQESIKS
jgi:hypothetical protein